MHYRPLSLACDSEDNLLVVVEYKPVPHAMKNGKKELSYEEFGERSKNDWGACFYPFYRIDRRIRVYATNPNTPEESMTELLPQQRGNHDIEVLYYPANQWRDNGDMLNVVCIPDEKYYVAPEQKIAIVQSPALARATSLVGAKREQQVYMADEYNKTTLYMEVDKELNLKNPVITVKVGEYSAVMTADKHLFVADCIVYDYVNQSQTTTYMKERPAVLLLSNNENHLHITARTGIYAMKIK